MQLTSINQCSQIILKNYTENFDARCRLLMLKHIGCAYCACATTNKEADSFVGFFPLENLSHVACFGYCNL